MVKDYPDFTRLMQIIGSEIMVPLDLQAAYIMMPIDIQAQYIDLEVDIVAQTIGNIAVDIVANTLGNLAVDINAQTIGDLAISIEAQNIGVKLGPEWETHQGTDKNLTGNASLSSGGWTNVIDYTVTAGKTFYACQFGFCLYETGGIAGRLYYTTGGSPVYLQYDGGYQGGGRSFSKPMAVAAGDHVKLDLYQNTGAPEQGYGSIGGYEV